MLLCRALCSLHQYSLFKLGSGPKHAPCEAWVDSRGELPPLIICARHTHKLFGTLLDPGQGPVEVTITIERTPKPRKE